MAATKSKSKPTKSPKAKAGQAAAPTGDSLRRARIKAVKPALAKKIEETGSLTLLEGWAKDAGLDLDQVYREAGLA